MTDQSDKRQKPPNKPQPRKIEMVEVIVMPVGRDQLAGAVLAGGDPRREREDAEPAME